MAISPAGLTPTTGLQAKTSVFRQGLGTLGGRLSAPKIQAKKIKIKLCLITTGKTIINQKHINHKMFKKTSPLISRISSNITNNDILTPDLSSHATAQMTMLTFLCFFSCYISTTFSLATLVGLGFDL